MENIYSKYLEGIKVPDNIEIDNSPYSKYLPSEERQKFKITTKGNRGSNLTNEDIYVPMSDGSYLTVYDDDSAASNGVALYADDNASNAYEKLMFVAPSNANVNVHTSTTVSDRADSAEVQATANLSLQTNIRAFILGH